MEKKSEKAFAYGEDSEQTASTSARKTRMICGSAGLTCHFIGFATFLIINRVIKLGIHILVYGYAMRLAAYDFSAFEYRA